MCCRLVKRVSARIRWQKPNHIAVTRESARWLASGWGRFFTSSSELRLISPPSQVKPSIRLRWRNERQQQTGQQLRLRSPGDFHCVRADVSSTSRCFSSASLSPSFIRNADELKPRSGFHFYTSFTLQSLASPSIRPLVLSSHAVIEKQAPVLIGSFPLRVHLAQFSWPSMCASTLPWSILPWLAVVLFGHIAAVYVQNSSAGCWFYSLPLLGMRHSSWCWSRPRLVRVTARGLAPRNRERKQEKFRSATRQAEQRGRVFSSAF